MITYYITNTVNTVAPVAKSFIGIETLYTGVSTSASKSVASTVTSSVFKAPLALRILKKLW